jgi:putative transposase
VTKQCKLLALNRSSVYYRPVDVSQENLRLMKAIDEIHLEQPFRGSRRIRDELLDRKVVADINRKKVQRLMRKMGLVALYPKKKTSLPGKGHKIYPYLLKDLTISRPNQVWATDICYIPMAKGFLYLVAVMDWHSRKVLSWRLSNTMDTRFCLEALDEAIERYGRGQLTKRKKSYAKDVKCQDGVLDRAQRVSGNTEIDSTLTYFGRSV